MKKSLIYSMILIGGLLLTAALTNAQEPEADKPATEEQQVMYTCPMHPEVVQAEPGKCPKCGMDLVMKEKKCEKKDTTIMHHEHMKHEKEGCKKKEEVKEEVKEE